MSSVTEPETFDPDILLDLREVSVVRGGNTLLKDITWRVELDERWIIIGPNGAGKTTLLKLASANDYPTSGKVIIMGEQVGKTDMRDLKAMIGMSSAAIASRVPDQENVADLVISAGYAIMGRWRETYEDTDYQQALTILEMLGALHLKDRTFGTLSEGEKKRVLIARALMTNPELLLLDEPGAGLDLGGREDLVGYLSELAYDPDAPATVMVTHHVEEIPPGFTHAMLIDEGEIIAQGFIDDVLTDNNLTRTFHQPIAIKKLGDRWFARRVRVGGRHKKTAE